MNDKGPKRQRPEPSSSLPEPQLELANSQYYLRAFAAEMIRESQLGHPLNDTIEHIEKNIEFILRHPQISHPIFAHLIIHVDMAGGVEERVNSVFVLPYVAEVEKRADSSPEDADLCGILDSIYCSLVAKKPFVRLVSSLRKVLHYHALNEMGADDDVIECLHNHKLTISKIRESEYYRDEIRGLDEDLQLLGFDY